MIMLTAALLLLVPVFAQGQVGQVSYFQEETGETDLETRYEKLELRLRELEDDYASHAAAAKERNETEDEESEQTAGSLKQLDRDFGVLAQNVCAIQDTIPGMVHHNHCSPRMILFGRIHLDYWAFPNVEPGAAALEGGDPQDRFGFRRLRLGARGDLFDNMFYVYEGEFADGNFTEYRDAFLGFSHLPVFNQVIIGNHKRPYGLDHLNDSNHNVFMERPLVVEAFNPDSRRLGISSSGFSDDLRRNWRYGIWNMRRTQDRFGYIGDHYQLEFASRSAFTPWYDECSCGRGYFHFATSSSIGFPNGRGGLANDARFLTRPEALTTNAWLDTGRIVGANTTMLNGVESVFNYGPMQLAAEYQRLDLDRTGPIGTDLTFHGGYFYVSYFLTGEHMPWDRRTGTLGRVVPFENFFLVRNGDGDIRRGGGAWQVAARYSYADLNDLDIVGGQASALTLGLNWYWNPFARMQFNYVLGDVKRDPIGSGDYEIFGMRFMVDF